MKFASLGIILEDNKIFLIKRPSTTIACPNMWAGPGGRSEEGETPEETATREVKEEVNLDFKPCELFFKGNYNMDLFYFLGDHSGNIKLDSYEIADCSWFSYSEAVNLDLAFDFKDIIEKLHKLGKI